MLRNGLRGTTSPVTSIAGLVVCVALVASAFVVVRADTAGGTPPGASGKIVFTSTGESGLPSLELIEPDGSGHAQLLAAPVALNVRSPAWSPDGQRVAFAGSYNTAEGIYSVNADGSGIRRLVLGTGYTGLAWSPDGGSIAYMSVFGPSIGVSVLGEEWNTPIGEDLYGARHPSWSPDGDKLAFTGFPHGGGTALPATPHPIGRPTDGESRS